MRIAVVEDELLLRQQLIERLRLEGFDAEGAQSALAFYRGMAVDRYDIAIIDIGLPDENGLEVASWLRSNGDTGVIVVSGRAGLRDRISAFEKGADLYFSKPVDGDELVQAIRSLSRRLLGNDRPEREAPLASAWFLDPVRWALQAPGGVSVKLTAAEMKFIRRLLLQPGSVVPRPELHAELGYAEGNGSDQRLDALVRRLRRKIATLTDNPAPIQTAHGQGYSFSAPLRRDRRTSYN